MEKSGIRVVIIGSGNVATHLSLALDSIVDIVQVWSRNMENAAGLAGKLKAAVPLSDLEKVDRDADFYLVAVNDDAVPEIFRALNDVKGIIAHTSGSVELKKLIEETGKENIGVFYPLQTFSKTTNPDIKSIPFFIEGSTREVSVFLKDIALHLSERVFFADSDLRRHIHLAAVFANNFANYMWDIADRYLRENTDFDIKILKPLLEESLRKAMSVNPYNAQTGPAVRGDSTVIAKHESTLNGTDKEIYKLISDCIIESHKITDK